MDTSDKEMIRESVRTRYAGIATAGGGSSSTGCGSGCGCGVSAETEAGAESQSARMGYSSAELSAVPEGADLGLGCGNPHAIAGLRPGEVVADFGSGGGFDCFLASRAVGEKGRIIGVDMTPEMLTRARANARRGGHANVEFRLGEIEHLPIANDSVDVAMSNCVINLSPEKKLVFEEAFRVLKPGGRLAVADVVAVGPIPEAVHEDLNAYAGCVAGASTVEEVTELLSAAGFVGIEILVREESGEFIKDWQPGAAVDEYVRSAFIQATKPETENG